MPQQSQNKMKGTSPSKNIQRGVDQAWGQQNKGSTNPKDMINKQWNKQPVKVGK
jgi:hypothetical protein